MKSKLFCLNLIAFLLLSGSVFGQDISLYQQFNGRYDFTFIGNTLNTMENGDIFTTPPCIINTNSSATLALNPNDTVEKAYLYWAGSGPGDFAVKLNGQDIVPDRTFNLIQSTSGLIFFSAFKDITDQVLATGNGSYTFSDMDLNDIIPDYCPNQTNFGGWAMIVVYKNEALPLNQLNVYDGLDYVSQGHTAITINLNSLNVIDNEDARIGFVAWEGDKYISTTESLRVNDNLIDNPPLNPGNNAFNGTNSITGSSTLFNMDLDIYGIQNNIDIGDTSAQIQLTSGQDFVMINAIVTKLNSQLPDATISIDNVALECDSRIITVDYTVYNAESTNPLPGNVPISIYADDIFVGSTHTTLPIPIDGSQSGTITLTLPDSVPDTFELLFVVDFDETLHHGIVTELNESNNRDVTSVSLWLPPAFNTLGDVFACNQRLGSGTFDFSGQSDLVTVNPEHTVSFFETLADAENNVNEILNTTNYFAQATPKEIFVRIDDGTCFSVTSFFLKTRNCPPIVYNFVSANGDSINDGFFIKGLRDIFLNFKLRIYNRWGNLVWTGDNSIPDWDGFATKGMRVTDGGVPDGTYYYVLDLNDPDYNNGWTGFLYLTHH